MLWQVLPSLRLNFIISKIRNNNIYVWRYLWEYFSQCTWTAEHRPYSGITCLHFLQWPTMKELSSEIPNCDIQERQQRKSSELFFIYILDERLKWVTPWNGTPNWVSMGPIREGWKGRTNINPLNAIPIYVYMNIF